MDTIAEYLSEEGIKFEKKGILELEKFYLDLDEDSKQILKNALLSKANEP